MRALQTPVSHLEPVRAFIEKPHEPEVGDEDQLLRIFMEHMDGRIVFEGTASASLVPGMLTTAAAKIQSIKPVQGELLFARRAVGTKTTNVEKGVSIHFDRVRRG